jgi:hypothetical protein
MWGQQMGDLELCVSNGLQGCVWGPGSAVGRCMLATASRQLCSACRPLCAWG